MATETVTRARARKDKARVTVPAAGVETKVSVAGTSEDDGAEVYTGKNHAWAVPRPTRINHDSAINLLPTLGIILLTWLINRHPTTHALYDHLNATYSPFALNAWGTFIITTGVYWLLGLLFMALDMTPLHAYVKKYKIQPKAISWADYRAVCGIVLRNQVCVNIPLSMLSAYFHPLDTRGETLPGLWRTAGTYFFCLACEEVGFFAVHRAVHSRALYAKVHKLHHQFTAPVALASTYCTMTEHLFSNLLPILAGVYIINAHWSLMIMFFCSLEIGTLSTHSDYNIPGLNDALQHDWHHYSFTENFGPVGLLDEWFGTNKGYKAWLGELKRRDAGISRMAARAELVDRQ